MPFGNKGQKAFKDAKKMLKEIDGMQVEAGWFESAKYGTSTKGSGVSPKQVGESIAVNARRQEFGTATMPARPFMRMAAMQFSRKRTDIQMRISKRLLAGQIDAKQAVAQIGMAMEGEIVDSIKNGKWTPNAPSTIRAKGFDKPLVDTAQMFQTVTSKVT